MPRRRNRKVKKMMRRTMRQFGQFAADALAEFAGNALYHGMKRFSKRIEKGEREPPEAH